MDGDLQQRPWARVRDPLPIPQPVTVAALAELDDEQFAQLLRSHLVPRDPSRAGKQTWASMWALMRTNLALGDRAIAVLEEFAEVTGRAQASGQLDEVGAARAKKFEHQVSMALDRVQVVGAMDWAGEKMVSHPPHSRKIIAELVAAIARHRSAVLAERGAPTAPDAELWDTLARLGLDPRDYPTFVDRT